MSSSSAPTSVLLQELQSLKSQESTLIAILSRCNTFLNKLKVEELQLKAMLRDERNANAVASASTNTSTSAFVNTETFDSSLSISVDESSNYENIRNETNPALLGNELQTIQFQPYQS